MKAIILAGGKGSRLKPFTTNIPKPLIPIGEMPILEVVLRQLKHHGFTDVTLAVNHLAELLMAFFRDGKKLGLEIDYSLEDKPLGTAGPIRLVTHESENFLIMNGDLLTTIDYADMYRIHVENDNDATIAVYNKKVKIDLGVLETDGLDFLDYIEKPTYDFDVSMGIYILKRSAVDFIPEDRKYDMPDLMLSLKENGKKVQCYRGDYYWLDIGRIEDYEVATDIFEARKKEFLPDEQ